MDDFFDRPELSGTLISMEFGQGGRIGQMWVANPNLPDENEEFQFVLSPINMGDEIADDYFPGTILIGARTHPDDPWIVSRNASARQMDDEEDPSKVSFEYEFSFLEELEAVGKFYEKPGVIPQICWDVTITNRSRTTVEIGELAFPFALNNLFEGYPLSDDGMSEMYKDRVYVHKFIGGSASYLFAQRLNADAPGLLIFPGTDTRWEFYNHVPASLNTPFRWEGIPVVYVHSRATVEREEWKEWFNEHTTLILEPAESKTYQIRFVPTERDRFDSVNPVLAACGQPAIRLLPGAVAPADVGIALEVSGVTPTRFFTDERSELETDSDEEGGFCFIKPDKAGLITLSFEDTKSRESNAHLLFIEPIESLINARAKWIIEKQILKDPTSNLHAAIVPTDVHSGEQIASVENFSGPFGVESSLADALFLAEKNTILPEEAEIAALKSYIEDFLLDDLQNPSDGTIGSAFFDTQSVAMNAGRSQVYALATNLFMSASRLAELGYLEGPFRELAIKSAKICVDLVSHGNDSQLPLLFSEVSDLVPEAKSIARSKFPYYSSSGWTTTQYREVAHLLSDPSRTAEAMRLANAARSLSPSWWWYASDKRWQEESEMTHPAMADKGEMCLGPTSILNSLMFLETLSRDYTSLPDSYLRLAFGGLLSVWALVRADGAGSMGFCPDAASKQFGMSALSGDLGIGLFAYLRYASSYVLPTRNSGVITFGCHFEIETKQDREIYIVKPWDGVSRSIVIRQIGMHVKTSFGQIREFRFDSRKRWAHATIQNPVDKDAKCDLVVQGMWGRVVLVDGKRYDADAEGAKISLSLKPGEIRKVEIMVAE